MMACSKPLPKAMWCQTDFEKYDFSYKWTISNICGRMAYYDYLIHTPEFPLISDEIKWQLLHYCTSTNASGNSLGEAYNSISVYPTTKPPNPIWVDLRCAIIGSNGEEKCSSCLKNRRAVENDYSSSAVLVNLVRKKDITKEGSEYLVDGALNLQCNITLVQWGNPKDSVVHVPRVTPAQFSLNAKLEEARKQGQLTDVIIVCKTKKELKAHRIVLAAHSSVLRTRFEERWQQDGENKVDMTDMDDNVLDAMLTFLYTGDTKVVQKLAHEMLQAADKYDIKDLKAVCEEQMSHSLTMENVIHSLVLADTHNAPALKKVCIDFICSNKQVMKSKGWKELKRSERNASLVMDINKVLLNLLKI